MRLDDLPESSNIEDRRGETGGGGFGGLPGGRGGLGIGTIVVLGLVGWALGIDPRLLIGGAEMLSGGGDQTQVQTPDRTRQAGTPQDDMGRFVARILGSTEVEWSDIFTKSGKTYRAPRLVMYSGSTDAGCGAAQSAMGPFYCPTDQKVYLDTSFFRENQSRFRGCDGKSCQFAQAYVIAHEVGHHVQNLLGILPKVEQQQQAVGKTAGNQLQVKVELQADCLAEFGNIPAAGRLSRSPRRCRAASTSPGPADSTAARNGLPRLRRDAIGLQLDPDCNALESALLPADCLAGVWANHSEQQWNLLEPGDVDAALRLFLQRIVADRRGGAQGRIDVARLQQIPLLLGMVCPDSGETPAGSKADSNALQVRVELQADSSRRSLGKPFRAAVELPEPGDRCGPAGTAAARSATSHAAEAGARLRGAGFLYPRHLRAAPALVQCRPQRGHRRELQHIRGRAALTMPGIDESRQFLPLRIAVLTVSDTRELADDKSGATLSERIAAAGHVVAERAIVEDDADLIRARVKQWIDAPAVDVIITTGGTGFTGRDVTPEAVEPLFEKRMEAFAALFLMVSFRKIGTSAIQTRATAGVAGATYIFCLPGSPGACRDAWDENLVHQLDYRYRPCNFVEIMPRLDEHLRRPKAKGATV